MKLASAFLAACAIRLGAQQLVITPFDKSGIYPAGRNGAATIETTIRPRPRS